MPSKSVLPRTRPNSTLKNGKQVQSRRAWDRAFQARSKRRWNQPQKGNLESWIMSLFSLTDASFFSCCLYFDLLLYSSCRKGWIQPMERKNILVFLPAKSAKENWESMIWMESRKSRPLRIFMNKKSLEAFRQAGQSQN